jgi:threonine efflux protein
LAPAKDAFLKGRTMLESINLPVILAAALIASASPGPATMAIAGTSMTSGRKSGLTLAAGVLTGSITWSILAALGLGAIMRANAWMFEVMRYLGAAYLLYLAWKSARSALSRQAASLRGLAVISPTSAYAKGLMLHLTNPKPILFFGSLFAIGVPSGSTPETLALVVGAIALMNIFIFHGYALLFSSAPMVRGYMKLKRWFEAAFALLFGAAAIRILTTRI